MQTEKEAWANSDAYERFMGRWSARVAPEFLRWLAARPGGDWLDVGCGTGILTRAILETQQPRAIIGIDASDQFVAYARRSITAPNIRFQVGNAQALELETASVDAVVSGIMLNFVPQPEAAVAEMRRVAKPGDAVGAYVWDYASGMAMLRYFWDAAVALDTNAAGLDQGARFTICQPGPLRLLFADAGLQRVDVIPIEVATVFPDFEDYWTPFLGGVGSAPTYMKSLSEDARQRLKARLRETLPIADDGAISLTARAWAVKGIA